ncbi:hypothetical protein CEXT_451071 [Caerostris extrusa]|uniref:Uncharacterized protein n=1 Tax=Caerostris extrusa TaxID=172846 RepID=A0AAV4WTP6_CAEEX|nr:hypothetical protein CEXT_451071 [Caerostris extrusa]
MVENDATLKVSSKPKLRTGNSSTVNAVKSGPSGEDENLCSPAFDAMLDQDSQQQLNIIFERQPVVISSLSDGEIGRLPKSKLSGAICYKFLNDLPFLQKAIELSESDLVKFFLVELVFVFKRKFEKIYIKDEYTDY